MIIRKEITSDSEAIDSVTAAAFMTLAISRHTEPFIIRALRAAGALTLSLVAEDEGGVVGHIAFSPVAISDGTTGWYGIGPVSVLPAHQRQGIGTALINRGISLIKEKGGQGCALAGDPNYYKRFGFRNDPALTHVGIPQEFFLVLPFTPTVPKGTLTFHPGFGAEH